MNLSQIAAIIERCQPYALVDMHRSERLITVTIAHAIGPEAHRISFALDPVELSIGIEHAPTLVEMRACDAAEELRNHLAKLKAA